MLNAKDIFPPYHPEKEEGAGHECTSWMIFSDLTKNNTNILHKNRDSKNRNVAVLSGGKDSGRKWIGLGSKTGEKEHPCMGMNTSGLAGVMNSGMTSIDNSTNPAGKTTPAMLKVILEESDTAKEALDVLLSLIKAEDYFHGTKGSTFFLMDTKEGYICEFTAHHTSVQRYDSKYVLQANIWHNPGIDLYTEDPFIPYLNSCGREYIGKNFLNHAYREKGCLTRQDCLDLARYPRMPEDSPLAHRSISHIYTNSSSTFVIDQEFPGVLSTGFFTIGHPRHTICVPVPVCAETFHPKMVDAPLFTWSSTSYAKQDIRGFDAPIPEEWLAYEEKAFAEYESIHAEARKLLKEGRKEEAVQKLNDSATRFWAGAARLLGLE